ncbi:MAG: hypothetical protein BME94_00245 [Methanobacteriales archaeon Met13]
MVKWSVKTEISDFSFRFMNFTFKIIDFIYSNVHKKVKTFGINEEMIFLEYGCVSDVTLQSGLNWLVPREKFMVFKYPHGQ